MKRAERFLLAAYKASLSSTGRFPIGAVLTIGSRIISSGFNRTEKSHPKQPSRISYGGRLCAEPHAELDCLIRAPYERIKGSNIYIARRLNNGDLGLAKPCYRCVHQLKSYGVNRAVYTTSSSLDEMVYKEVYIDDLYNKQEKEDGKVLHLWDINAGGTSTPIPRRQSISRKH